MTQLIAIVSYAAAAAAFLFLFLLLMASWQGRLAGGLLALASFLTSLWAAHAAFVGPPQGLGSEVMEVLRTISWLTFLVTLLGFRLQARATMKAIGASIAVLVVLVLALSAHRWAMKLDGNNPGMLGAYLVGALLAVAGMVLVEQLFRNSHPQQRWAVKYLCFGAGALFAYDFYLYADAMLFQRMSETAWAARGLADAMVVPFIAVSAARNPRWSVDVFVSRRFLFHSAALIGAGIYLLVMAAAGYYIRYFGGTWGAVLQIAFLFGALLLLVSVLFSGTLRARTRVFLSKNFFSYRFDYRDEWLDFTRRLSAGEPGVRLPERTVQAIADLVESPAGALWLAQEASGFDCVAHSNMPAAGGAEPRDSDMCRFLEVRQWVIIVEECRADPGLYNALRLPAWLQAIPDAWCVVPLIHHEHLIGFVVLARPLGDVPLDWEVRDLLKTAGCQAASYLAQMQAARQLMVARQFESVNRMAAFVVHDLKNLVSQLSLLLANADRHMDNPAFRQDLLDTVAHSIDRMKRLVQQLRAGGEESNPALVNLDDMLTRVVSLRAHCRPRPSLALDTSGLSVVAHPEKLERVIGHLVQNAIEATPPEGNVGVRVLRRDNCAVVEIADTGCGMSEAFVRDGLFKPFESTKPAGMGVGAYETREYARELGGRLEVVSQLGLGSTFRLLLPLAQRGQNQTIVSTARGVA